MAVHIGVVKWCGHLHHFHYKYLKKTRLISDIIIHSFLQGNGYKPTPLDLTTVYMNERMEELVDMLAENTHNVWAKDRIKHGWTYGLYEVGH